jgi:hypothetical protein
VLRAGEFDALVWDDSPPRAQIADVLRVHDLTYVDRCVTALLLYSIEVLSLCILRACMHVVSN